MRPGQDVLEPRVALASEWLLGNGIGGFSSGTAPGAPRLASHALLVAATPEGALRRLLIALDERVHQPERVLPFDASDASGPEPWPSCELAAGESRVRRTLFMIHGHHAIVVAYRWVEGPEITLSVGPLVPCPARETRRGPRPTPALDAAPGCVRIGDEGKGLVLWHDGSFLPAWIDREIGTPDRGGAPEPVLQAGHIEARVGPGRSLHLIAGQDAGLLRALAREDRLGAPPPHTLGECVARLERDALARREGERRLTLEGVTLTLAQAREAHRTDAAEVPDVTGHRFDGARDSALGLWEGLAALRAVRGGRPTLLRAWPGAEEDGVATLRSLRAWIALRRFEEAREFLTGALEYLDEGFAPSSFDPESGAPRYERPEPSLWLAVVGELYARRSGDLAFVSGRLLAGVDSVIQYFRSGTRLGVRVAEDGLLSAPAKTNGGRAALNALWYQAQIAGAQLARAAGHKESAAFHLAWAVRHQQRFVETFWNERRGRLIDPSAPKGSEEIGPAQLLALGSPPLLDPERTRRAVESIEHRLFTPYGLRRKPGDRVVSTAWLGPFYAAYLRAHQRSSEANARVRGWIEELLGALPPGSVRCLPEAFVIDDEGARPRGATCCAVATAELLRVWVEEVDHAGG